MLLLEPIRVDTTTTGSFLVLILIVMLILILKPKPNPRGPAPARPPAGAGINSKLLGALLAGVNRAFPYLQDEQAEKMVEENSSVLYRIAHTSTFSGSTQALTLLYQCMASRDAVSACVCVREREVESGL